jgi:4-hydroxy-tetrahydrodipicolinate reductase
VVFWGLDANGLAAAALVRRRSGYEIAGAISGLADQLGRDLGDLLGFGERLDVIVNNDPMGVLTAARPDVTVISAPGATVAELGPRVLQAVESGSNVVCLAEEMVYPWASSPEVAESLDEVAHAYGVTILGTGLAPGFVLDTLAIALTGCCSDVERIRASRAIDVSGLGADVLKREYGIGLSPSHYAGRVEQGWISRVGLEQSIHLIADTLGWKLERVEEDSQPILAETRTEVDGIRVDPGQVAGRIDAAVGYVDGLAKIVLEHPQTVGARTNVVQTGDYIEISGRPEIRMTIQPEIATVEGTAAIAVNMIPAVMLVGPGLKTMAELPVPRAVLYDVRDVLEQRGPTVDQELARGWHEEGLGGHDAGNLPFPGRPGSASAGEAHPAGESH